MQILGKLFLPPILPILEKISYNMEHNLATTKNNGVYKATTIIKYKRGTTPWTFQMN